jgi:hypothetical protein
MQINALLAYEISCHKEQVIILLLLVLKDLNPRCISVNLNPGELNRTH